MGTGTVCRDRGSRFRPVPGSRAGEHCSQDGGGGQTFTLTDKVAAARASSQDEEGVEGYPAGEETGGDEHRRT